MYANLKKSLNPDLSNRLAAPGLEKHTTACLKRKTAKKRPFEKHENAPQAKCSHILVGHYVVS